MRHRQVRALDAAIAIGQQVQVERSRRVKVRPLTASRQLEPLQCRQQFRRCQMRLHRCDRIDEFRPARLVRR
jgi:hypothetical protein